MNYEQIALKFAEKYGIINYTVKGNTMTYYEQFTEGSYKANVNLDTLQETRTQLKRNVIK